MKRPSIWTEKPWLSDRVYWLGKMAQICERDAAESKAEGFPDDATFMIRVAKLFRAKRKLLVYGRPRRK